MSLDRHYEVLYIHMYPYMICAVLAAATVDKHVHFFYQLLGLVGVSQGWFSGFRERGTYSTYGYHTYIICTICLSLRQKQKKTPLHFLFLSFGLGGWWECRRISISRFLPFQRSGQTRGKKKKEKKPLPPWKYIRYGILNRRGGKEREEKKRSVAH